MSELPYAKHPYALERSSDAGTSTVEDEEAFQEMLRDAQTTQQVSYQASPRASLLLSSRISSDLLGICFHAERR